MPKLAIRGLFLLCLTAWLSACQVLFGDVSIERSPLPASGACTVGSFRCNSEYLLSCQASAGPDWFLEETCASADRCDSKGQKCQICRPGDLRCMGAVREECSSDGSTWLAKATPCASASQCNPTGCFPCIPGTFQCRGSGGNELYECDASGEWTLLLQSCATAPLCESSLARAQQEGSSWAKRCETPGCTDPGHYSCAGPILQRCRQDLKGYDTVDTCLSAELCASAANSGNSSSGATLDMCPLGCSVPGAPVCEGQMLKRCREDLTGWTVVTTCPPGTECNPIQATCTDPCDPGDVQCNGKELRRCSTQQTWEVLQTCESEALCGASIRDNPLSSPKCLEPTCPRVGDYRCEGASLFKCSPDLTRWEPQGTCDSPALCNALSKRCDPPVCGANALQCFDNELRRCKPDRTGWDVVEVCTSNKICSADPMLSGCLDKCPRSTICINGTTLWDCNEEMRPTAPLDNCLTPELCTCSVFGNCQAGTPGNKKCGTPVCAAGERKCEGGKLLTCKPGRDGWVEMLDCKEQALCDPGTSTSPGFCRACPVAGEVRCGGPNQSELQTCSADRRSWVSGMSCTKGCIDSGSTDRCAVCSRNEAMCAEDTLKSCASDRLGWVDKLCAPGLCDAANAQCDVCKPNSNSCGGTGGKTLLHCSADGQTLQETLCPNLCDAVAGECDSCVPGSFECSDTTLLICAADGQSTTAKTCLTSALCDEENGVCKPAVCAKDERRCAGAQPQICAPGRDGWEAAGEPCATEALCDKESGTCAAAACAVNAKRCNGAQPQVCNADRTEFVNSGTACASEGLCKNGLCTPPTCMVGQFNCDGAWLQKCKADRSGFENTTQCARANLCNDDLGRCDTCSTGEFSCSGAKVLGCNETLSGWDELITCADPTPICDAKVGQCVECQGTEKRCEGSVLQVCGPEGQYVVEEDCSTSALNCDPNEKKCSSI